MAYLVASANSDYYLCVWKFYESSNASDCRFELIISSSKYHNRCVQKSQLVVVGNGNYFLFSAGTDGLLAMWDVSKGLLELVLDWRIHQSGIKAMSIYHDQKAIFVASGGDDNSIAVLTIPLHDFSANFISRHTNAHGSSVTGCCFLNHEILISISIDQRMNKYQIKGDELCWIEAIYFDIADAGDIVFSPSDGTIAIVGQGIHFIVEKLSLSK
jgi:WD40 repeat protein